MKLTRILMTTLALVVISGLVSNAQVIVPRGETTHKASQLVVFLIEDDDGDEVNIGSDTNLQITNHSNTSDVTIHVQIWVSDDGSGDPVLDPCVEIDFTDTFTPNDTHNYDLSDMVKNTAACLITDDCVDADEFLDDFSDDGFNHGFITVTPVVGTTDRRAIAFNHMSGIVQYNGTDRAVRMNTVGREARSFITSALLPDGTLLDGVTGGYSLLQPEILSFNFSSFEPNFDGTIPGTANIITANVALAMFTDNYSGPFGDYRSQPSSASFDTLIFDHLEVPTSCQRFSPTCMISLGINEDAIFEANTEIPGPFDELCPDNNLQYGWVRLTVTGIGALSNVIGMTSFGNDTSNGGPDVAFGRWMISQGDSEFPAPTPTPTPTPSPTPTPDGSGGPTPTGGDGPGGGGGGSGCAIAGPVQAGTAFANMLMVLLPGAAFALRRRFAK